MHQFSKVEMFVLCTPHQSEAMLAELCSVEEEIFTELGLHFQMLVADMAIFGRCVVKTYVCHGRHPAVNSHVEYMTAMPG